jgi:hypothetical protein
MTLPLVWGGDPSPYILKGADGLDISDINQFSYGLGLNGQTFYSMTADDREITLQIEIIPEISALTPQQIRNNIYKEISKNRNTSIYFDLMYDSEVVARIDGYISAIEPSLFSPISELTIKIKCNGYLFSALEYISDFDLNAFNGGDIVVPMTKGNAPVGFRTVINIVNPISSFGLAELDDIGSYTSIFNLTYNFLAGDSLFLTTEMNALEVFVARFNNGLGTWSNIQLADRIDVGSIWPILFPRTNNFTVLAAVGTYDITSFVYKPMYWGI